jgi:hypothetical protein
MNAQVLADLMESQAEQMLDQTNLGADAVAARKKMFLAMATAIVTHIQTQAGIVAGPIVGLATGPGGGPVSGAATLAPGFIK